MHELFNTHFKRLFALHDTRKEWFQTQYTILKLNNEDLEKLHRTVKDEEIKNVIFAMTPWKAPRPDGFPVGFYKKLWKVVDIKVCEIVERSWENPTYITEVNQTNIFLIPKTQQPEYVHHFRPISLCNTIYKVVSKVIIERLEKCIPKLVSPYQTSFVPGRSIQDNIIVAQEMVHNTRKMKGKRGSFIIKVGLSKAYDKVSWEFIWRVLEEKKIPSNLVNMIMHGITSVETNIKWNGVRSLFFRPSRGIRHGNPISPYILVLCVDKLSHPIQ